jgi:hypothetical protein
MGKGIIKMSINYKLNHPVFTISQAGRLYIKNNKKIN